MLRFQDDWIRCFLKTIVSTFRLAIIATLQLINSNCTANYKAEFVQFYEILWIDILIILESIIVDSINWNLSFRTLVLESILFLTLDFSELLFQTTNLINNVERNIIIKVSALYYESMLRIRLQLDHKQLIRFIYSFDEIDLTYDWFLSQTVEIYKIPVFDSSFSECYRCDNSHFLVLVSAAIRLTKIETSPQLKGLCYEILENINFHSLLQSLSSLTNDNLSLISLNEGLQLEVSLLLIFVNNF